MKDKFELDIQAYLGLDKDNAKLICELFKPESIKKGEFFLKAGHYSSRLSYITSGYFRMYIDLNDKEVTQWIGYPNSFITDLSSLVFDNISRFNIQAITDCEIYSLPKSIYAQMGNHVPNWHKIEKLFIAKCFTMLEDRVTSHLSMSAQERYQMLYERDKSLFNHVPLQYLASMLGMSPETLSRIRHKIKD